ncbi:MAG: hypothetical protein ABSC25_19040 [Roseiarcus sp.]|jgi:hypothetical protein
MAYAIVKQTYEWPESKTSTTPLATSGALAVKDKFEDALNYAETLAEAFDDHCFVTHASPPYHWGHNADDKYSYHFVVI